MKRERVISQDNVVGNYWVTVRVTYMLGGHNWLHGTSFPRGYYLSVGVVERLPTETPGVRIEQMVLGHGFKSLLKEAARFSQKALDTVVVPHGLPEQLREKAISQAGLVPVTA
jgi:hypothetical protein